MYKNPIIDAASSGNLQKVKDLLVKRPISFCRQEIERAFRLAARNGHPEIVKILIAYGVDIHSRENETFYWIIQNGDVSMLELILSTDLNNQSFGDILKDAAHFGNIIIVKLLLKRGFQVTEGAFIMAVMYSQHEIVQLFLDLDPSGSLVHAKNDYAIRDAASEDDSKLVRLLIKYGANIHINNDEPLRLAENYPEIAWILLENGADFSVLSSETQTIFQTFYPCIGT